MHNPLATSIMDPNTIYGPIAQKMVWQHRDRFWMSSCFDDSCRLQMNLGLKLVPLEAPWNYLFIHIKNVQNGFRMWLGRHFLCRLLLDSEVDSNLSSFWASTLGTRTGSALSLLLDLENFVGLLHFHAIYHVWPYTYLSCPHHSCSSQWPLIDIVILYIIWAVLYIIWDVLITLPKKYPCNKYCETLNTKRESWTLVWRPHLFPCVWPSSFCAQSKTVVLFVQSGHTLHQHGSDLIPDRTNRTTTKPDLANPYGLGLGPFRLLPNEYVRRHPIKNSLIPIQHEANAPLVAPASWGGVD